MKFLIDILNKRTKKKVFSKIYKFYDFDGWLTEDEAMGLYLTAQKVGSNATVVEIGSWQGKSTVCIAKGLKSGKLYAIDPFNADGGADIQSQDEYNKKGAELDLLEKFKSNMQSANVLDKIVIKKGYSHQFHQDFNTIDFLFIDGDHSIEGCKADFDMYASKVVVGGFIAFHDYYADRPELGPTHVVDNVVMQSPGFQFYKLYDSLWVAKKIAN